MQVTGVYIIREFLSLGMKGVICSLWQKIILFCYCCSAFMSIQLNQMGYLKSRVGSELGQDMSGNIFRRAGICEKVNRVLDFLFARNLLPEQSL